MKKLKFISLATLLVAVIMLLSESKISAQVDYFKDFKTPLSLEEICLNNAAVYLREWKFYDNGTPRDPFYSRFGLNSSYKWHSETYENLVKIITLDVFSYFNINDQYNTELKKSVFKESADYKEKLGELKSIKTKVQTSYYYFVLHKMFAITSDDGSGYAKFYLKFGNYDLKKLGVKCEIVHEGYPSDLFNGFIFNPLPIIKEERYKKTKGHYIQSVFIPMSKENGLDFENTNKDNISVLMLFKPDGGLAAKQINPTNKKIIKKIVINKLRLIVINNETDKVYFDKIYSIPKK